MFKGPDISSWQGDIDINSLSSQVDFFIFRSHAGASKDSKVDRNVQLTIQNGKPYGLYIYSYALNTAMAVEEAQRVINVANNYSVKPKFLVIDMEDADGYKRKNGMPSNQTLKDICTVMGDMFEKAGYYTMVYANTSWFNNQLAGLTRFDKWVAHWPVNGNGQQRGNDTSSDGENANNCGIWQFTSQGRLNGYNGNLDMNYCYKDIILGSNYNPVPNQPEPVTKSIDEIANEVIAGQWGNGVDRSNRLRDAGYNPEEIQNTVNAKLGVSIKPVKSIDQVVNEVIAGQYGNGQDRTNRLRSEGYNPEEIQNAVNSKLGASVGKSNEQIANEVIRGQWGVGQNRKNRLTQAGYNPDTIQSIVNSKL